MSELTEFLLARISEDEKNARSIENCEYFHGVDSDAEAEVLTFSAPARVLRECEAKRRIVEDCKWMVEHPDLASDYDLSGHWESCHLAMCALATVYADHPDFRDEWSVEP